MNRIALCGMKYGFMISSQKKKKVWFYDKKTAKNCTALHPYIFIYFILNIHNNLILYEVSGQSSVSAF